MILDNPREITIATGQLLDTPIKAALGVSLAEQDPQLITQLTQKTNTTWLFPLRNRVAHHTYQLVASCGKRYRLRC